MWNKPAMAATRARKNGVEVAAEPGPRETLPEGFSRLDRRPTQDVTVLNAERSLDVRARLWIETSNGHNIVP
jgi:hypothetical protein